jgi:hypothetical protein
MTDTRTSPPGSVLSAAPEGEVAVVGEVEALVFDVSPSRYGPIGQVEPQTTTRQDYECVSCSYGAVARVAPERCPMCHGSEWRRRFARAPHRL